MKPESPTNSLLADAFRNKSVFVTGHTGFKGSWLCMWLEKLQARVTGYALAPPTEPSNFETCNVQELLAEHHEGDIRDAGRLEQAIRKANPDIVLHLAAESVVRRSYRTPRETFETNVMGTVNVLEAVRQIDRPCTVVCVTSDKCYENREQVWGYRESDAFGEHDPYGASKGAAEIAIRSYRSSFFRTATQQNRIKLASGRAGNVLGGGDFTSDALLVDVVRCLNNGEAVPIRSPGALRPWQHVLQALSGYMTLAARLVTSDDEKYQSGFNFGPMPGNEFPVSDIVNMFIEHWGAGSWSDMSDSNQPHESTILRLAIDKAIWTLDWRPLWDIQQTLEKTVQWYRAFYDQSRDLRDLCGTQIDEYTAEMQAAAIRYGSEKASESALASNLRPSNGVIS